MLKLGFHCLGLLKQRWTPSQFYTKHCLLSPQRSLSRDLEPGRIFPHHAQRSAALRQSGVSMHLIDRSFPVLQQRLLASRQNAAAHTVFTV